MTIFQAAARPTFTAPVEITVPGIEDDGAPETHQVVIEFKRLPRKQLDAFQQRDVVYVDAAKDVVVGWRLLDSQGEDIPFSPDMLDALLDIAGAPRAIFEAFVRHSYGAARKN